MRTMTQNLSAQLADVLGQIQNRMDAPAQDIERRDIVTSISISATVTSINKPARVMAKVRTVEVFVNREARAWDNAQRQRCECPVCEGRDNGQCKTVIDDYRAS